MRFANEDEIKAQCETDSFEKAVEYAKSLNMIVAITRSADGSVIVNNDEVIQINPVQVDRVVDTTGAGDAFRAGLLAGMKSGWSRIDSLRLANAMGSLAVELEGTLIDHCDHDAVWARAEMTYGEKLPVFPG